MISTSELVHSIGQISAVVGVGTGLKMDECIPSAESSWFDTSHHSSACGPDIRRNNQRLSRKWIANKSILYNRSILMLSPSEWALCPLRSGCSQ